MKELRPREVEKEKQHHVRGVAKDKNVGIYHRYVDNISDIGKQHHVRGVAKDKNVGIYHRYVDNISDIGKHRHETT